eukprot:gene56771-biopygen38192
MCGSVEIITSQRNCSSYVAHFCIGVGGDGAGADQSSNYQRNVERWVTVDLKLVTWNYLNFQGGRRRKHRPLSRGAAARVWRGLLRQLRRRGVGVHRRNSACALPQITVPATTNLYIIERDAAHDRKHARARSARDSSVRHMPPALRCMHRASAEATFTAFLRMREKCACASPGPVLGHSWASSGPALGQFRISSGPVLSQFWASSGPFWISSGAVLGQSWASSGPVLCQFWASPGPGPVLDQFWASSGAALGQSWASSGPALGQLWTSSGSVLDQIWASSGPVLDQLRASSGPVLSQFWASSGPVLA